MYRMITVLSLFDGISCGQAALEKCGIKYGPYYASEINKYAIAITQYRYPHTIQIGDVVNISFKDGILVTRNGTFNVNRIDLIMGVPHVRDSALQESI